MKVIVKPRSTWFQNKTAYIAADLYCPVVKNGSRVVLYVFDEAQKDLLLKEIYRDAMLSNDGYFSIKVKKYTPILDRRYKKKEIEQK